MGQGGVQRGDAHRIVTASHAVSAKLLRSPALGHQCGPPHDGELIHPIHDAFIVMDPPEHTGCAGWSPPASRPGRWSGCQLLFVAGFETTVNLIVAAGIHYCLGAGLARLEGEVAFRALADRLPGLELGGAVQRRPSQIVRGALHLPLKVRKGAAAAPPASRP